MRPRALFSAAALLFCAGTIHAQSIAINIGTSPQLQVLPGATVNIPVEANLAQAGALNIASLSTGLTWNTLTGGFAFSTLTVGASAWPVFNPNTAAAASGSVSFQTSNTSNLPATNTLAIASFARALVRLALSAEREFFLRQQHLLMPHRNRFSRRCGRAFWMCVSLKADGATSTTTTS